MQKEGKKMCKSVLYLQTPEGREERLALNKVMF